MLPWAMALHFLLPALQHQTTPNLVWGAAARRRPLMDLASTRNEAQCHLLARVLRFSIHLGSRSVKEGKVPGSPFTTTNDISHISLWRSFVVHYLCVGGGGVGMLVGLPLAVPIGLSPLHILTLCGYEHVLVVSMEPLDDLSCLTTPGSAVPETGCCPCH